MDQWVWGMEGSAFQPKGLRLVATSELRIVFFAGINFEETKDTMFGPSTAQKPPAGLRQPIGCTAIQLATITSVGHLPLHSPSPAGSL